MPTDFVPDGFEPPRRLDADGFWLEPLGPEHNEADHAAWMSSIDHIRATPGFPMRDGWPEAMPAEANLRDLEMHEADFRERRGFTYTVRSADDGDVVGCVYIYPDREGDADAHVESWARASHAELDVPLWRRVSAWLDRDWPFTTIRYAERQGDAEA